MPLSEPIGGLTAKIDELTCTRPVGRVTQVQAGVVHVSGLADTARIGDWISIQLAGGNLAGEVVGLRGCRAGWGWPWREGPRKGSHWGTV